MTLKFEINNNIISKGHSDYIPNDDSGDLFASFTFNTKDWRHLEKYAIFWNRKGKSTIRYITDKSHGSCPVPHMALNDLYFYVQVYANDDMFTQKLKVYNYDCPSDINKGCPQDTHFLRKFIDTMDTKIDNIVYQNNKLLIYSNNKLLKEIDVIDEMLVEKVLTGRAPQAIVDMVLSNESENPVANKVIFDAMKTKVEREELSPVAFSGSFRDLKNIPLEFKPKEHTHYVEDVVDFDDEINEFLDELSKKFI